MSLAGFVGLVLSVYFILGHKDNRPRHDANMRAILTEEGRKAARKADQRAAVSAWPWRGMAQTAVTLAALITGLAYL